MVTTKEGSSRHSITDLEKLYQTADEQDKELFAEQRSNILLYSGEHYNKLRSTYYKRLREVKSITEEQRLRLTKNHTKKIVDAHTNHIMSAAPGVGFEPANDSELQDLKTAELNHSVWEGAREEYRLDEKTQNWAEDFTQIGEVAVKLFWDPDKGQYLGDFMPDPQMGEMDQAGAAGMTAQFSGDFVFEEVFGFNLLMDTSAPDHRETAWMCIRKMVDTKKLKKMFPGEDNQKFIQESADQTFTIFDRGKSGYEKSKDKCMLREMYFRPCFEYPQGYVYYFVKEKILHESELPAGKFPIVFAPFQKLKTRPRGQSIIKTIRPFQMEINRAASKMAEHQVTLGDDKVLLQNGSTMTTGKVMPGVRSYNITGAEPTIMAGRDGSQYAAYMAQQTTELYNACEVDETEVPMTGQVDPYSLLYRSASQKKKFRLYVSRFEQFLVELAQLFLDLARYHYPDEKIIQLIGKNEQVNLSEFRNQDEQCYRIKVVAQSDDIETKLGKQLVLSQALQYTAGKFDKQDIGKLMKAMPYADLGESFNDMTMDYESGTNVILQLDRGQQPPISEYDDHVYMIKRLTNRMRQGDFATLPENVQQNYHACMMQHQQLEVQQQQAIQAAEAGFIPTDGYLVACEMYVQSDPKNPADTKRIRVPSGSLQWLIQKLETQGSSLEQLESVNQGNLAQMAQMMGHPAVPAPSAQVRQPAQVGAEGNANGTAGQPASAGAQPNFGR